jgi:hypothetical protein
LEGLEVPGVSQAIAAYRKIIVTKEFREYERLWSKARHDEAQALFNERRGIARKLLLRNRPIDEIVEDTGLTREEVEDLRISM